MTIRDYSFFLFRIITVARGKSIKILSKFYSAATGSPVYLPLRCVPFLPFDACPIFVSFHLRFSRVTFKGDRVSQEFNDRQNGVSGRRIYNTVGNLSSNSWPRHDKSRALKERRKIRVTEREKERCRRNLQRSISAKKRKEKSAGSSSLHGSRERRMAFSQSRRERTPVRSSRQHPPCFLLHPRLLPPQTRPIGYHLLVAKRQGNAPPKDI